MRQAMLIGLLGLAACGSPTSVIGGNADQVTYFVAMPDFMAPGPMAARHCDKFGKSATLDTIQPIDSTGRLVTFRYVCSAAGK